MDVPRALRACTGAAAAIPPLPGDPDGHLADRADPRRPRRDPVAVARPAPRPGWPPGDVVRARLGARRALAAERPPRRLGADDDPAGFDRCTRSSAQLVRRHPGLRVGRTSRVLEALVPAVLEQKVVGVEAHRAWRHLLLKFGAARAGAGP